MADTKILVVGHEHIAARKVLKVASEYLYSFCLERLMTTISSVKSCHKIVPLLFDELSFLTKDIAI